MLFNDFVEEFGIDSEVFGFGFKIVCLIYYVENVEFVKEVV